MAELKSIVRISGVDLDGSKPVGHQITKVKGVGSSMGNMILNLLGIDKSKISGELSETEIDMIEKALDKPTSVGAPAWMLNRRKDPETGEENHLVGNDLKFIQGNDIKTMRKIKSYKGTRHGNNLPVRGQKTKSNFRRNKGKVAGVKRKK